MAPLQDTSVLGFHTDLLDVELLRECLSREPCVVARIVDCLSTATGPHAPNGTLVLGKLSAVRLRGELLSSPRLDFENAARDET